MNTASHLSVDTTSAQVCSMHVSHTHVNHDTIFAWLNLPLSLLSPADLLEQSPPSSASSSLSLPGSLFSDVFANRSVAACSEVGVVSLVYGGIGPRLTLNDDQLLASIGCSENTTSDDVSDEVW